MISKRHNFQSKWLQVFVSIFGSGFWICMWGIGGGIYFDKLLVITPDWEILPTLPTLEIVEGRRGGTVTALPWKRSVNQFIQRLFQKYNNSFWILMKWWHPNLQVTVISLAPKTACLDNFIYMNLTKNCWSLYILLFQKFQNANF